MGDTAKSKDYVDNPSPIQTLDSRLGLFGLDCIYNFEAVPLCCTFHVAVQLEFSEILRYHLYDVLMS